MRLVSGLKATDQRAQAYLTVVKALADAGELREALTVTRRHIPTADQMARALAAVVRADPGGKRTVADVTALVENGLLDRVTNPDRQLQPFAELVKAIADGGDLTAAGALADRIAGLAPAIEHPERRAQLLVALARGVDPGRARRLLADVLTGPAWPAALVPEAGAETLAAATEELASER